MSQIAVKLHGVDQSKAIPAIKALRSATQCSLRWAKLDVYDKVRAGHPVVIACDEQDIAALDAEGWALSLADGELTSFTARVPVEHVKTITAVVNALGGQSL